MKLVGIMPVRNEAWCLGLTLRVALKWCDEVVVNLHSCTDCSADIVRQVFQETGRVRWMTTDDKGWNEMIHRQALLEDARKLNPTHIALIDADEFLTGNILHRIRGDIPHPGVMLELPGYNLRPWGQYHSNGVWGNRWFATAFKDTPNAHWTGDRFHHREPMGVTWVKTRPIRQGDGGTLHLWGASERRLRAKHALYKVTERLRFPKKTTKDIEGLYNLAIIPRERWDFKAVPADWLEPYADLMQYLHIDADPWQIAEVKRLYREYGAKMFDGLDLFGVETW